MYKYEKEVNVRNIGEAITTILNEIMVAENASESISRNIDLDKEIDRVVFNEPATIVFWKDGDKTVVKCHEGDVFNKEAGLAMCIVRKLTGNKRYNEVFEKYCK